METSQPRTDRVSPFQFISKDLITLSDSAPEQFPCNPTISESIKKNLRSIPGWDATNTFDWAPGYKIRLCGLDQLIGASIIRSCAQSLHLNLVTAPERCLARLNPQTMQLHILPQEKLRNKIAKAQAKLSSRKQENELYLKKEITNLETALKNLEKGLPSYSDYIVEKNIVATSQPLSLAQVQQFNSLLQKTGYRIGLPESIIHGTDGIVYLDNISYMFFSQAKDPGEFELDVYYAMNCFRTKISMDPIACVWLDGQIAQKFEQLKAAGVKFFILKNQ